jgi:hypothetical protein
VRVYAFLIERVVGVLFDIHRLVYIAVRNWLMIEGKLEGWERKALLWVNEEFLSLEYENREV